MSAYQLWRYIGAPASSGDTVLRAAVANRRLRVAGFILSAQGGVQTNVIFRSNATAIGSGFAMAAGEKIIMPICDNWELSLIVTAPGEDLRINLAAATAVGVHVTGWVTD